MKARLIGSLYKTRTGRWSWKVVLTNDPERKRRSIPLKPLGSKFATKDRKIAEECAKRILQEHILNSKPKKREVKTILDLCVLYREYIKEYYAGSSEGNNIVYAIAYLEKHCPRLPVDDFDSLKLMEIREKIIDDREHKKTGLTRDTVNRRISVIKRMFKWGVANRHCSPIVFQLLEAVENLKMGRSRAREPKKVTAVSLKHVDAVLPHLSDTVASMVRLQVVTGMRSTEICLMRPCDIDRSEDVWIYRPSIFKGQHRVGYERVVPLGKKAQEILNPFLLRRTPMEYLFKPEEGDGSKKHRHYNPHYNKDSYGLAIRRKIGLLNKEIKKDCLNDAEYMSRMIQPWTPHQLRHTFATMARKQEGTETARASLGHTKLQTLDVYAERDQQLAIEYARKYG